MSQSTLFQLCWDGSSWVEPVLSKHLCLAQGHNAVPPMRLEPAALLSQVKHSTTELPLLELSINNVQDVDCFGLFLTARKV